MKIYSLKQKSLEDLERNLNDNKDNYLKKEQWITDYFSNLDMPNFYFDTGIEVSDYELIIGGPETDYQNAKRIYEALSPGLNPVQASDLRLWAYMTHVQHWDYMNERWLINAPDEEEDLEDKKESNKTLSRIKSRYFFENSRGKSFVRNGIARLYWSAYLTYDENNDDPYEYTEYLLSKQDLFSSITERSFARNKVLVLALLKELKSHPDLKRSDIRLYLTKINQAGAITVLDYLNQNQAEKLCADIMHDVTSCKTLEEGTRFVAVENVTGDRYGAPLLIQNGRVSSLGKIVKTKPQNLLGKKVGTSFKMSGRDYVVKEIF